MKVFIGLVIAFLAFSAVEVDAVSKRVVCYYYAYGDRGLSMKRVNPNMCTHIIYDSVFPDRYGKIYYNSVDSENIANMMDMKVKNPNIKIMAHFAVPDLSYDEIITGNGSSLIVGDDINLFITNSYKWLKDYDLDGVDMDLAATYAKNEKLVQLLSSMRVKMPDMIISVATAPVVPNDSVFGDVNLFLKSIDFINVRSYNFLNPNKTLIHTQLYGGTYLNNANDVILHWINVLKIPRNVLNMGIAFYGLGFHLLDPANQYGIGAPVDYTSYLYPQFYSSICNRFLDNPDKKIFSDLEKSNYVNIMDDYWFGYDDQYSLTFKTQYIIDQNLGGAMVWSLTHDDYDGWCNNGPFPLLRAVASNLGIINVTPLTTTTQAPATLTTSKKSTTTTQKSTSTTSKSTTKNVSTTTEKPKEFDCNGKTCDQPFPDPKSCAHFYFCFQKKYAVKMTCDGGTKFNPAINACSSTYKC